jgi:hypothetical protein
VYVFGGQCDLSAEYYSTEDNTWTCIADVPFNLNEAYSYAVELWKTVLYIVADGSVEIAKFTPST